MISSNNVTGHDRLERVWKGGKRREGGRGMRNVDERKKCGIVMGCEEEEKVWIDYVEARRRRRKRKQVRKGL